MKGLKRRPGETAEDFLERAAAQDTRRAKEAQRLRDKRHVARRSRFGPMAPKPKKTATCDPRRRWRAYVARQSQILGQLLDDPSDGYGCTFPVAPSLFWPENSEEMSGDILPRILNLAISRAKLLAKSATAQGTPCQLAELTGAGEGLTGGSEPPLHPSPANPAICQATEAPALSAKCRILPTNCHSFAPVLNPSHTSSRNARGRARAHAGFHCVFQASQRVELDPFGLPSAPISDVSYQKRTSGCANSVARGRSPAECLTFVQVVSMVFVAAWLGQAPGQMPRILRLGPAERRALCAAHSLCRVVLGLEEISPCAQALECRGLTLMSYALAELCSARADNPVLATVERFARAGADGTLATMTVQIATRPAISPAEVLAMYDRAGRERVAGRLVIIEDETDEQTEQEA